LDVDELGTLRERPLEVLLDLVLILHQHLARSQVFIQVPHLFNVDIVGLVEELEPFYRTDAGVLDTLLHPTVATELSHLTLRLRQRAPHRIASHTLQKAVSDGNVVAEILFDGLLERVPDTGLPGEVGCLPIVFFLVRDLLLLDRREQILIAHVELAFLLGFYQRELPWNHVFFFILDITRLRIRVQSRLPEE